MMILKSRVVNRIGTPTTTGGGISSVVTDGVTVQGNGTSGSPIAIIPGVYDPAGSAAAVAAAAAAAISTLDSEKQDTLVSGTNIKTINGTSVLGSGDITIDVGASSFEDLTGDPYDNTALEAALNAKGDVLLTTRTLGAGHTLDATDLTAVNEGKNYLINTTVPGVFTIPLNATVDFEVSHSMWIEDFTTVAGAVGVTVNGTNGTLNVVGRSLIEQISIDTWTLYNGEPDASETVKGLVELATTAEATTGTDTTRAVTAAGVKAVADLKAPLASPTFTGTVIAPTPTLQDDSTKVATTEFVVDAIYGGTQAIPTGLNNKLVGDGNSQMAGALLGDTNNKFITKMFDRLGGAGSGYSTVQYGVGGQTSQDMEADAVSQIDVAFDGTKTKNYLVAMEIENDAFNNTGLTAAQLYTNISTYYENRQTAGYHVIAITSPKRAYYGLGTTQLNIDVNNRIADANALLLATSTSYNQIVDVQTIPRLANQRSRVGYFYDDVHFNESGHSDLADALVAKVRSDLGQPALYVAPKFVDYNGNTPSRSMIIGATNSYPLGFISNGKVRAEVATFGSFIVNCDVVASADNHFLAGVGSVTGFGMIVSPGLTAGANNDVLAALCIQPAYFDPKSYTGVVSDMFRINKYRTNGYSDPLFRIGSEGRLSHTPIFTAVSADVGCTFGGTVTGFTSGTFTQNLFQGSFTFSANNTGYLGVSIAPNITRGAFTTSTPVTALSVNSGSGALAGDIALAISAVAGVGVSMTNHAGTQSAISIVSSSTVSGCIAVGVSATAGVPIVAYKTNGTTYVQRLIHQTSSNLSSTVDMVSYERSANSQAAGCGISFPYTMNSSTNVNRLCYRESTIWTDNTNTTEVSARVWSTMVAGTLAERMRLEGGNLSVGFGATPTAFVHIGAGTTAKAPLKLTTGTNLTAAAAGAMEYDNTFHLTNSDATRRHVVLAPNTTKVTAGAPYTNDGYITVNIGGTDFKLMTTA